MSESSSKSNAVSAVVTVAESGYDITQSKPRLIFKLGDQIIDSRFSCVQFFALYPGYCRTLTCYIRIRTWIRESFWFAYFDSLCMHGIWKQMGTPWKINHWCVHNWPSFRSANGFICTKIHIIDLGPSAWLLTMSHCLKNIAVFKTRTMTQYSNSV